MTTLEDLYYGNISPHERYIERGTRVDKLVKLICKNEDELTAGLTEKQKEVFESVHLLGKTKREIAANKKVSHTAINDCYDGALKRLRKFFAQYPEFLTYFPGLKNR